MPHIFISYSHKNQNFAKRIEADLQASGYNAWRDESHGVTHHDWQIDVLAALDSTHVMLVILSPESVASKPVDFEIMSAQARGIPIVAIQYTTSSPHPRLQDVVVIDFTQVVNGVDNDINQGIMCEATYLFTFIKLRKEIDQVQPMLQYLGQLAELNPQVRRMATTSEVRIGWQIPIMATRDEGSGPTPPRRSAFTIVKKFRRELHPQIRPAPHERLSYSIFMAHGA